MGEASPQCGTCFHRLIPSLYGTKIDTHDVCIDIYDPDLGKVVPRVIPVMLASDVLSQIWKKQDNKLWSLAIGATSQKTHAFWKAADKLWASNHPVLQPLGGTEMSLFVTHL